MYLQTPIATCLTARTASLNGAMTAVTIATTLSLTTLATALAIFFTLLAAFFVQCLALPQRPILRLQETADTRSQRRADNFWTVHEHGFSGLRVRNVP